MAVHLAVAGDVFDVCIWCLSVCFPFSHDISWVRSGTELSQFLRTFLLIFVPFFFALLG